MMNDQTKKKVQGQRGSVVSRGLGSLSTSFDMRESTAKYLELKKQIDIHQQRAIQKKGIIVDGEVYNDLLRIVQGLSGAGLQYDDKIHKMILFNFHQNEVEFESFSDLRIELDKLSTLSSEEDELEEPEEKKVVRTFMRTGHSNLHSLDQKGSVARAEKKGNTYNGRWKSETEKDKLINRFYDYLIENKLLKDAYFVECDIPLSVGCADDQDSQEHQCDGFFIKMTKMGSAKKKWTFSTCYPAISTEIKGNVKRVAL